MVSKEHLRKLGKIVGKENVLHEKLDLFLYGYDGSMETHNPDMIVFASSTEQVAQIVRFAAHESIPLVARGSGTNLSGGSVPAHGGIILDLTAMKTILEIDTENRCAVVQAGVYNLDLQQALHPHGYQFAPDPASQQVSTIGGNVAENAGGPHCLKYGVTTNHVLGMTVVLPSGEVRNFGGKALDTPGYDLVGIMVSSEGTLGVITEVTVRIIPLPEGTSTLLAIFDTIADAANTVSEIIAGGIVPATLEMMDAMTVKAVEASLKVGYPTEAGAVLLIEVDGPEAGLRAQVDEVVDICMKHTQLPVRIAQNEAERDALWSGRRGAYAAMTNLRPSIIVADGTVPRAKLPQVLKKVGQIAETYGVQHGNLLHAGDGNLHPNLVFDYRDEKERARVLEASHEILKVCVEAGGTISGEHGVGLDKISAMPLLFTEDDMCAMFSLKHIFDPENICNPGKIFPQEIYDRFTHKGNDGTFKEE